MNYQLHDFLDNRKSFYFYLYQNNYEFFNDKQAGICHQVKIMNR